MVAIVSAAANYLDLVHTFAHVPPEELLTTGETAKRLGLSRSTLWRYVKAGLIEPDLVTAGGHFRFDPEHVRRQLRALQQRGDS